MSLSCGSWNWNSQCSWMQHMSQFFKRSWTITRFDFTFLTLRVVNLREVLLELRAVFFVSLWCGFIGLALSECSDGLSLQKPGPGIKKGAAEFGLVSTSTYPSGSSLLWVLLSGLPSGVLIDWFYLVNIWTLHSYYIMQTI